jgi:hypothetical protein
MEHDDDQQHLPWNEGLPTRPDVDLLIRTWPEPKIGDVFAYESIGKLLRVDPLSNRFRTVTNAWRDRLRKDMHLNVFTRDAHEFFVATPEETAARTWGVFQHVANVGRGHGKRLQAANVYASEATRPVLEHQMRLAGALVREAKKARMNALPSTEVKEPPKISPPKKPKEGSG